VRRDDVPPRLWKLLDEVTLARLTKVRHPELIVALEAIATGHPSGRIRKAAKRAGHKLGPARRGDPRRSHDRERG
jgi:hypothetical protein